MSEVGAAFDPAPGITALAAFDEARRVVPAGARARALRRAGERLGDRLRASSAVRRVEVLSLERVPCAVDVAFDGALRAPLRWITLERRMLFVELELGGAVRRVLVDPVEPGAWRDTPWGAWFVEAHPRRAAALASRVRSIEGALATISVSAATIDLSIVTHLRGQDLRATIGTARGDGVEARRASVTPSARWIVPRTEWEGARDPHEHERPHLVREGLDRVDESRIAWMEGDLALGDSAALVATPGLTDGHATLFVRSASGVLAWSSHGVAPDAWSPYHARLPGLRARVRELGVECVPRGDAAARGDALTSMSLERAVTDARGDAPAFRQILPQQELAPAWWTTWLAQT